MGPGVRYAIIDRSHRPDSDARVGQENLIGSLQILAPQLAFPGGNAHLPGFAQHDPPHDPGHAALIDARCQQDGLTHQEHVGHGP